MPHAYVAAPLFTDAERAYNEALVANLEEQISCYLPQRDGLLLAERVRSGGNRDELARLVFNSDMSAIRRADLVIAVLDGVETDAGVAVEIGAAWAVGKPVFGLRTDSRRPIVGGINPMVEGVCHKIVCTVGDLLRAIATCDRAALGNSDECGLDDAFGGARSPVALVPLKKSLRA